MTREDFRPDLIAGAIAIAIGIAIAIDCAMNATRISEDFPRIPQDDFSGGIPMQRFSALIHLAQRFSAT